MLLTLWNHGKSWWKCFLIIFFVTLVICLWRAFSLNDDEYCKEALKACQKELESEKSQCDHKMRSACNDWWWNTHAAACGVAFGGIIGLCLLQWGLYQQKECEQLNRVKSNQQTRINQLQSKHDNLLETNKKLGASLKEVEKERSEIQIRHDCLREVHNDLKEEHGELRGTYEALQNETGELRGQRSLLEKESGQIRERYHGLLRENGALQERLNAAPVNTAPWWRFW